MSESLHTAFHAAHQTAAIVPHLDPGWVRLQGRDRVTFLQRLSTNDVQGLKPGQGLPTVLASATGRVLAFLLAYIDAGYLDLRVDRRQSRWLTRHLNSLIFFQDQLEVVDLSEQRLQYGLMGPLALDRLESLLPQEEQDLDRLPSYAWRAASIVGVPVTLCRGGPLDVFDWTVSLPASGSEPALDLLEALGPALDPEALDALRVEKGIPAWGHELSDQVTPIEAGLAEAISYTKGCYTGQEVIARQTNYDKVMRRLVGLLLPDAASHVAAGAEVRAESGRPGFVGTVAWSPAMQQPIALAIVPRGAAESGTRVMIVHGEEQHQATVTALPFASPLRPA